MDNTLILLVSLCFAEFVHNTIEIWGMRQKVSWLSQSLAGKEHGRWPVHIDTKSKTIIFHLLILILSGWISYFILKTLNFSEYTLIIVGIAILIINYIFTTWKVDKFHAEIGKIIAQIKLMKD